jgi:hypothetical protein
VEGAVSLGNAVDGLVVNSIVWGNATKPVLAGMDLYVDSPDAMLSLDHADVGDMEVEAGTLNDLGGNLATDPALRRLRLAPESPMVDAGTCVGQPPVDLDGDPRPTGAGCDIGADELVP